MPPPTQAVIPCLERHGGDEGQDQPLLCRPHGSSSRPQSHYGQTGHTWHTRPTMRCSADSTRHTSPFSSRTTDFPRVRFTYCERGQLFMVEEMPTGGARLPDTNPSNSRERESSRSQPREPGGACASGARLQRPLLETVSGEQNRTLLLGVRLERIGKDASPRSGSTR